MLLCLLMSAAVAQTFGGEAPTFAAAYLAIQLLRSAFMVAAFPPGTMRRNYAQLLAWSAIAGVAWMAGAFTAGAVRLLLWALALLIGYAAPVHGFAVPGLGRTPIEAWSLAGSHLAERCQLVLLIALGESVLAVGATHRSLPTSAAVAAAFVVGFAGTAALWWVQFAGAAAAGARLITEAADPARMGRAGYAYAHAVMVAGVIVVAVAIELTIAHLTGATLAATAAVILAGPAIFLAGNAWFKAVLHGGRASWSRLIAVAALAALNPLALVAAPLALSAATVAATIALAALGPRTAARAAAAAVAPAVETAG